MVEDGLDKVEDPEKNVLDSAKEAVKSADIKIIELETELKRVNKIKEEQKEINDKLNVQLLQATLIRGLDILLPT